MIVLTVTFLSQRTYYQRGHSLPLRSRLMPQFCSMVSQTFSLAKRRWGFTLHNNPGLMHSCSCLLFLSFCNDRPCQQGDHETDYVKFKIHICFDIFLRSGTAVLISLLCNCLGVIIERTDLSPKAREVSSVESLISRWINGRSRHLQTAIINGTSYNWYFNQVCQIIS